MKSRLLLSLSMCWLSLTVFGQLNMTLLSHVQYTANGNDIWGWVAPDSTEYAIMGLVNGVSIVSLADPSNATEVAFIPGQNSTWRDIKTWGNYAYVTTDQPGTTEGLLVIDMSHLPDSVSYYRWTPDLPGMGTLRTCHNLWIDENGYCYLSGCNLNAGGILYLDVFTQPGTPIYVNKGFNIYSHDVYVRNDRMYTSEIYNGELGVYDISDKNNTLLLGRQKTPFEFTHNSWLSDDGTVAYTTDERANAPIGAFDVSDPSDIVELDQFRPIQTLGQNVIPHNVHVWRDWLIISYYTDGGVIVDASRPTNLIEVGNFDTFLGGNGGFSGAWGAYPFLPSGIVLVSDINSGLYVLGANYVRACWLEGLVTDATNGSVINEVDVSIAAAQPNTAKTGLDGRYETGLATAGTYAVTFSKTGYQSATYEVELNNGELTLLDVQLVPLAGFTVSGLVADAATGAPIPNAKLLFSSEVTSFVALAAADGTFSLSGIFADTYDVTAGAWGYLHKQLPAASINSNQSMVVLLDRGYQDDFVLDFGWEAGTGTPAASAGFWVRDEPVGTFSGNQQVNPETDVDTDLGDACFLTGNGGGSIGFDDVDNGVVVLSSPPMDLSIYTDPVISYNLWFVNTGGSGNPDDNLKVKLSNGQQTVTVETVNQSVGAWRPNSAIRVLDHFTSLTDSFTVIFETADLPPNGHVVEAAVDAFRVNGELVSSLSTPADITELRAMPNPFRQDFILQTAAVAGDHKLLEVYNTLGQLVEQAIVPTATNQLSLGKNWAAGTYFVRISTDGRVAGRAVVVKQ